MSDHKQGEIRRDCCKTFDHAVENGEIVCEVGKTWLNGNGCGWEINYCPWCGKIIRFYDFAEMYPDAHYGLKEE